MSRFDRNALVARLTEILPRPEHGANPPVRWTLSSQRAHGGRYQNAERVPYMQIQVSHAAWYEADTTRRRAYNNSNNRWFYIYYNEALNKLSTNDLADLIKEALVERMNDLTSSDATILIGVYNKGRLKTQFGTAEQVRERYSLA